MKSFDKYLEENLQLDERALKSDEAVSALSGAKYMGAEEDNGDIILDFKGALQVVLMKNGKWSITR